MHSRSFSMCTIFCLVVVLGIVAPQAMAQTDHSGICTGMFIVGDNPHRLTGTCTVTAGQALNIEAGVTLDGQGNVLFVDGMLQADNVTFTNVLIRYRDGSRGTLQNSMLTGSAPIAVASNSVQNPAVPVIDSNTITATATSVAIDVSGTAQPTVSTNTITTNNIGLRYANTAGGTVQGNTIGFTPEGNTFGRRGIEVNNSASPLIDNNTFNDDVTRSDISIQLNVDIVSTVTATNNTIHTTGMDRPFTFSPGFFGVALNATVTTNTLPDGVGAGFGLLGTPVQNNAALRAINGQAMFDLLSTWTINGGITLTIPAGITLDGEFGQTLFVDGTLQADGVTFSNVFINYRAASSGTLQNSTLNASNPISVAGTSALNPAIPTIMNNTITATSIAIDVSGTALPTISANTVTTNNIGLRYANTAGGTVQGNTIDFTPEGNTFGRRGIEVNNSASPLIDNNTFNDDATRSDISIQLNVDAMSTVVATDNSICTTGTDRPFVFGPNFFSTPRSADIVDNTLICDPGSGFGLLNGTITANATLTSIDGQANFDLISTLTVASGITLTVPAGITLDGQGQFLVVNGTLNADAATFLNVFVDFRDSSSGTLQNSTLSGSNPIQLSGSSLVNPATPTIRGNTITATSVGIEIRGTAQPTIQTNTITTNFAGLRYFDTSHGIAMDNTIGFTPEGNNGRLGIEVHDGASPQLDNNTITDDPTRSDMGIQLNINAASTVQATANSICATGNDRPFALSPGFFGLQENASVADTALPCGVGSGFGLLGATVQTNAALKPVDGQTIFDFISTWTVANGITLTIPAGLTLDGEFGRFLVVNGTMNADGVTFINIFVDYRDSSGGTLQNSTLSGSNPIQLSGSSSTNPAAPTIQGNTITTTSVGIEIRGTAQPTIQTNTITTNFAGLRYFDTSAGTASGNTIGFTSGAGAGRRGVQVFNDASPLIDDNTFLDDNTRNDTAVDLQVNTASMVTVTNNSICTTGADQPFLFGPNFFSTATAATVADNNLICDLGSGFALSGGNIGANATLVSIDGQNTFVLAGFLTVNPGTTLTIPMGTSLIGQSNTLRVNGTLNTNGATLSNLFIEFRAGSDGTLDNTTFTGTNFFNGLSITDAAVALTDNLFEGFATVVRLFGTAEIQAENNLFRNNTTALSIESPDVLATVMTNVFENNTHALAFPNADALFSAYPNDFETNAFFGSTDQNTIQVPATWNVSGTVLPAPVPYACTFGVSIDALVSVVLEPGVIMQCRSGFQIVVNGELIAVGTATRPVIFTVANPKGGNRWRGLLIRNKQQTLTTTRLEQCIIEFAGAFGEAALTLDNASIPIQNCVISDSNNSGIATQNNSAPTIDGSTIIQNQAHGIISSGGSNPLVQNNSIFNNGLNGIQNDDDTVVIRARNNFWGDDRGPRVVNGDTRCNTLSNPNGAGEEVSDCVDFANWIRVGPSIEGSISIVGGDGQVGTAGEQLPEQLVVEVRNNLDARLANIEVILSVVQGDAGIVEDMPVLTGTNGRAAATVQLGLTPGEVRIAVTARDVNSPLATFVSTSQAPLLFALRATGGCPRNGDVNQDGRITPEDALLVFRHFLGLPGAELLPCQLAHADVHNPPAGLTRELTPGDALCIFEHFLGRQSCLDAPALTVADKFRRN